MRMMFLKFIYMMTPARRLIEKNGEFCCNYYLNGFRVWDYYLKNVFYRIGHYYIGHGLCYEASALLMLVWHDHPKTRLVFADCWSNQHSKFVDHCWMEFKTFGGWWVIDATWSKALPLPKFYHNLKTKAKVRRVITSQDFWGMPLTQQFHELIKEPKTSYLFNELSLFRSSKYEEGCQMMFEVGDIVNLNDISLNNGEYQSLNLMTVLEHERPMTQHILRNYLTHEKHHHPKRRDYRKAICLRDTLERAILAAREHHEKTGNASIIHIDAINTFRLEAKVS